MTPNELGAVLASMHNNAPIGAVARTVHLFGRSETSCCSCR